MDIGNADYADLYFPCNHWEIGEKSLALAKFEWNKDERIYLFGAWDYKYGEPAQKPEFEYGAPQRIYSINEIQNIMQERSMRVQNSFSDYDGNATSNKKFQLMVYSEKI